MSTLNKRKKALDLLKRQMKKQGYEFKKSVKNTVTFRHAETGEKIRKTLVVD
jgi:hypothetical protein